MLYYTKALGPWQFKTKRKFTLEYSTLSNITETKKKITKFYFCALLSTWEVVQNF